MSKGITKISENNKEAQIFSISSVKNKQVAVSFTAPDLSSCGGLMLLREQPVYQRFLSGIAECIKDGRSQILVQHSYIEMIKQRVCQISAGYEDADDSDLLRNDSVLKMCADRLPSDKALSSQPTITRLENKLTDRELCSIGKRFIDEFIRSYDKEPEVIILDCDDSNFNTYGNQQGVLFNDYYGEYCFMPLFIFEGQSGKMILPLLKPGRRNKSTNVFKILRRLINYLRKSWKHTQFVVRGDSHFCCHELMDWNMDAEQIAGEQKFIEWIDSKNNRNKVWFITGLTGNKALNERVKPWLEMAKQRFAESKEPICFFKSFIYKAGSWKNAQRVIVKIEVNEKGVNLRFVVTNFKHNSSKFIYQELYCGRGQIELYIKELKTYLNADRTSCNRFEANQFRLFLHSAAYVILLDLKQNLLKGSKMETFSIMTLRELLLLSAVHIKELKTKIKVEFSANHLLCPELQISFEKLQKWRTAA